MKTIKKITITFFCAAALIYTPGCFLDFDDDDNIFGCVDANGSVVSEELNVSSFRGIELRISGKVYVKQGNIQRVVIEAPRRLIEELDLGVRDGVWEIETDRCVRYDDDDLRIFITVPDIRSLRVAGSGDIISDNTLVIDDLDLSISGSGTIDAAVDADDINAKISGSGDIYLEGVADVLDFIVSGSGDYRTFNLDARAAKISISGSGDAEVRVSNNLDVRISGSGDVRYKGNPSVNAQVSGSGKVINAN